jgi:hypothetical protein
MRECKAFFCRHLTSAAEDLPGSTASWRVSYRQDMSLAPLALTFILLVFWTGLGWSLIAAAEPNMEPLRALFLAPVAGVAITILPIFWLNILGLPGSLFSA